LFDWGKGITSCKLFEQAMRPNPNPSQTKTLRMFLTGTNRGGGLNPAPYVYRISVFHFDEEAIRFQRI